MENKEKQIEKMVKVYCHIHNKFFNYNCYIKSPCVMKKLCKEFNNAYARGYSKGSKETAEKFANLPKSKILTVIHDYEEIKVVELKELQELAEQLGVEIKE